MRAIIHQADEPCFGLTPLAGMPLIGRQLEWLRAIGYEQLAVEIRDNEIALHVLEWLKSSILGDGVILALTGSGLSREEMLRRLGWTDGRRVLLVPSNVIGVADLSHLYLADPDTNVTGVMSPPCGFAELGAGEVQLWKPGNAEQAYVNLRGWGVHVHSHIDALRLCEAILVQDGPSTVEAAYKIEPHGRRLAPGIYVARGAIVHPTANLIAPVFIGAGAVIEAGAIVGPGAVLETRAVIERTATADHCIVGADVVIGEGVAASHCRVTRVEYLDFKSDNSIVIDDPLIFDQRPALAIGSWLSRTAAFVLLSVATIALAPVWPLFALAEWLAPRGSFTRASQQPAEILRALLDVVLGRKALVGVDGGTRDILCLHSELSAMVCNAPAGLLSIDRAIMPQGATAPMQARALAWYAHEKGFWLDLQLILRTLVLNVLRRSCDDTWQLPSTRSLWQSVKTLGH